MSRSRFAGIGRSSKRSSSRVCNLLSQAATTVGRWGMEALINAARREDGQSLVMIALAVPVGLTVLAALVVAVLGPSLPSLVKLLTLFR
jgi:hypothetical protein